MNKKNIIMLFIFPIFTSIIAGGALYIKSQLQLIHDSTISTPEKIEKLVSGIKTGEVNLSADQLLSYLETQKDKTISENNFRKEEIDVWGSFAVLLIIISVMQFILLAYIYSTSVKMPNKSLQPTAEGGG